MKSYTIRKTSLFDFEGDNPIAVKQNPVGAISKDNGSTLIINSTSYQKYTCTFFQTIKESILVDGTPHESYQKSTTFPLYYSKTKQLIFVETSTNIAKVFLSALEKSYEDKVNFVNIYFAFNKIISLNSNVKGLYFSVDGDDEVDSKAFFGNEVHRNTEAKDALDTENATYLMISLDISGTERTIGFSQKGAIILYNRVHADEQNVNPYLELVTTVYNTVASSVNSR